MKTQAPLLTISLLISNRPDTIPRCLDSLRPIMDAIPSELILIDTSKNEEIHQMLLGYTDLVYEFEWCNDFAKARNEGIRRARGEWFFYLDDDEWLEESDNIIDFFQSQEYKDCGCANMQIRNYSNASYTQFSDGWVSRLFRLEGVRFEGKVHEYLYNLTGKQIFLPEMIHHSGYIYDTPEKCREHFERNSKMLLELIEEEPDELRWQAQMVQEYYTISEWEKIIEFCEPRVKATQIPDGFMNKNHFCTLYGGLADAYQNLGRNEEFFAVCDRINEDEKCTDVLKALMDLRKAETYINLEDLTNAKVSVDKYLKYYEQMQKNKAAMQEQLGALLINRTFEKNYLDTAYNVLIYIDLKQEKTGTLKACADRMEQDKKGFTLSPKLMIYLVELMMQKKDSSQLLRIVKKASEDGDMLKVLCAEAQKKEEEKNAGFIEIAKIYAHLESDFWYIPYCRLVVADAKKDKKAVKRALKELVKAMPNAFYLTDWAYEIIEKYQIKIALLWDEVLGTKWKTTIQEFAANCSEESIQKVSAFLADVYETDDWHRMGLDVVLLEKKIAAGPQMNVLDYYDLLKEFAQKELFIYQNILEKIEAEELPLEVQVATKINEYIQLETQDQRLALMRLKEVVDIYPVFARGIGKFFHFYSELEKERVKKQQVEMQELRNQVMEQICEMFNTGQVAAALQVVGQLKQMFPEDLEVAELALNVRLRSL